MSDDTRRYAVVTGGNKGIGFEICRQLASKGVVVILTAINEQMGYEAVEKLKACGFSDSVVFHQLDVADHASVAEVADFIRTRFGKLDILVNNAGVNGIVFKAENFRKAVELAGDWACHWTFNCVRSFYYKLLPRIFFNCCEIKDFSVYSHWSHNLIGAN
ncbi:hypothetical protein QQ045_028447 [Rhodiola kirilowii]